MKIAVFGFGLYRQFEEVAPTWQDTYGKYNPDYYITTWDTSREKGLDVSDNPYDILHIPTTEKIKQFLPNATVCIVNNTKSIAVGSRPWYQLKLCATNLISSNKHYDLIVVKRLDSIEYFDYNIFENINPNAIYSKTGFKNKEYDFFDPLWYGCKEPMLKFINEFAESKYFFDGINCHKDPDKFLYENKYEQEKFPGYVNHQIIRVNMRHLFKEYTPLTSKFFRDFKKDFSTLTDEWDNNMSRKREL
jgi:hypothetical protein|tara:strand:+ start:66 stop:806 length:741 start_codon:yes stop_codon:yes gene_type:complete